MRAMRNINWRENGPGKTRCPAVYPLTQGSFPLSAIHLPVAFQVPLKGSKGQGLSVSLMGFKKLKVILYESADLLGP